ncbi:DUF2256 domain-containing protein [Asaia sp. HN128]
MKHPALRALETPSSDTYDARYGRHCSLTERWKGQDIMGRGKGRVAPRPSKANLPEKICPVCHRPFSWRRKWARDWDQVRYCSDACRTAARKTGLSA